MLQLQGTTVVALEHAIAAPYCTRQLADLGARVIKVERPGVGDFARGYDQRVNGLSSHFVWTNRSEESLALDLKHPMAGEVLQRLLDQADVLVQNLAPGAAARLGLSYTALRDKHPRLVACDISGYGGDSKAPGPYRDKKAYDLLIQSKGGFLSVSGTADEPSKAGCSIADIAVPAPWPTATCSQHSSNAAAPGAAATSMSRCWRAWSNGWVSRRATPATAHVQLQARGRWTTVPSATGLRPALLPPSRDDARMDAIPALGQHTQAILAELGLADERHQQLHAQGTP